MIYNKLVLTLCLFSFSFGILQAQDSLLIKKVNRLMEVTGASKNFEVVIDQMIDIQKSSYEETLPEEFWEKFRSQMKEYGFDQLLEQLTPVYLKHLTEEELDGMIAFYESEIGRKVIQKVPLIQQESMQIGAEWGRELGKKIIQEVFDSEDYQFNTVYTGCSQYKEGKFIYDHKGTEIQIERKGNLQIEKEGNKITRYHIEWEDECRYKMWEIDEDNNPISKKALEVNIYEFDKKSYKYISQMEGFDYYNKGEIKKPTKQM